MKVHVKSVNCVYKNFFKIDKAIIQHEKFDGAMTEDLVRYNFVRGDAVAVLPFDMNRKIIYLTEQFRYPAFTVSPAHGWMTELVAGTIEGDDSPVDTAVRELEEEIGFQVRPEQLIAIGNFFPSPGGSSERLFLFAVPVTLADRAGAGGGLLAEAEDIRLVEWSFELAVQKLIDNQVHDGKTIVALQWFREYLRSGQA